MLIYILISCVILLLLILYNKFINNTRNYENMENNYLDGIDIIYWINLDRATDRKINMTTMLNDPVFTDVPNKRISATDGTKKPDDLHNKVDVKNTSASVAEYATLISHLDAIKEFSKSEYNIALIFEDDVTLDYKKYWKKTLKQIIDNAPNDWEIIMVGYNYGNLTPPTELGDWKHTDNEYINEHAWGAYSYIINKKAAKKLMKMCHKQNYYELNERVHPSSDVYIYNELLTYVYKYPMFTYRSDNDSYIHSNDLEGHDKYKEYIISQYEGIK
uniref:Glycosyl transferase family 25 domain-containing protein n=1 Tax=viral metagenome TaxID=1070528 RepID=A0A6C0JL67_9ZZZZ